MNSQSRRSTETGKLHQIFVPISGSIDGPLRVKAEHLGEPQIIDVDADSRYVQIRLFGDVGVEGDWQVMGATGGDGGTIQWQGTYDWSKNLGPWRTTAKLYCRRGASN